MTKKFYAIASNKGRAHVVYRFKSAEDRRVWAKRLGASMTTSDSKIVQQAVKEGGWVWRGLTGDKYQVAYVSR